VTGTVWPGAAWPSRVGPRQAGQSDEGAAAPVRAGIEVKNRSERRNARVQCMGRAGFRNVREFVGQVQVQPGVEGGG